MSFFEILINVHKITHKIRDTSPTHFCSSWQIDTAPAKKCPKMLQKAYWLNKRCTSIHIVPYSYCIIKYLQKSIQWVEIGTRYEAILSRCSWHLSHKREWAGQTMLCSICKSFIHQLKCLKDRGTYYYWGSILLLLNILLTEGTYCCGNTGNNLLKSNYGTWHGCLPISILWHQSFIVTCIYLWRKSITVMQPLFWKNPQCVLICVCVRDIVMQCLILCCCVWKQG